MTGRLDSTAVSLATKVLYKVITLQNKLELSTLLPSLPLYHAAKPRGQPSTSS